MMASLKINMNKKIFLMMAVFLLYSTNLFAADISINYSSVSAAFDKLKADPTAAITQKQNWTIISLAENDRLAIWYFTPQQNDVRTAVFKKVISRQGEGIETRIISLCEAPKVECDKVTKQFQDLNNRF
jgi:AAA15 family ATPase/GTPase